MNSFKLHQKKNAMLNETETRKIIDEQLRQVGWEADSDNLRYSRGTRPQKGRNIAVAEWQTDSGFVDYALFVGMKMVATIEAKATHKDISAVIDCQGKDYARNIRDEDKVYRLGDWNGFKVPFTFATNARPYNRQLETKSGIWFLDLRRSDNAPKALRGWISPTGIVELLERDISASNEKLQKLPLDFLRDEDGLNLRGYQIKAVQAAERAVLDGQKNILIAMATGTGKTRTVLGMIYRFLKAERFRRILFLVDRNSLGEQAQDVFATVKLEDLLPLDKIYNINKLGDKTFGKETRLQIATVQSMVKRILYAEDSIPGVTDFDLIIVDEAHRGYILDRELSDDEISFHDRNDYQSKYRSVIEYFDAVKIALTATPALHTTEIFGAPVFKYTYREAVIDGYLVDHDPPHRLKTMLSEEGIHYKKGDLVTTCDPVTGELINSELLDDELNFDIDNFNRQVVNENFNRVVLEEIAADINPEGAGKTLIFAVDDKHADLIVQILKELYTAQGISNDAITKITSSIGDKERVQDAIRRFKNERFPNVVVTVDLLTTGIDVPAIDTLVFMRRVKSRILFEQMLGRATRLCSDTGKTHFRIFDAVGVYDALEPVSEMKPVVVNATETFAQLIDRLKTLDDDKTIQNLVNQIIVRLRRQKPDNTAKEFIETLKTLPAQDAKAFLISQADYLQERIYHGREFVISEHEDFLTAHERGFGEGKRPQDYLDEFTKFIEDNRNEVAALNIVCTRPKDLTRADLKNLLRVLRENDFSVDHFNGAISQLTNSEITADIISLIRRYALGVQLMNHSDKISNAISRIKTAHNFSAQELKWLDRIEKYLLNEILIDTSSFDEIGTFFKQNGGFNRIDKVFGGRLSEILDEINSYLYDDVGNVA